MKYIIVLQRDGINYFLQMRNVVNWIFCNNHAKVFKSKKTAIANADRLLAKYGNRDNVYVFQIDNGEEYSASIVNHWYGTEKEVYSSYLVNSFVRHDRSHEEQLCIYQRKEGLYGVVRDSYGRDIMSCMFTDDDINGDEYRVKQYFGYTNENSY